MRRPAGHIGIGEAMFAVAAVAALLGAVRAAWADRVVLAIVVLALHRVRAQWRIDRAAGRVRCGAPLRASAICQPSSALPPPVSVADVTNAPCAGFSTTSAKGRVGSSQRRCSPISNSRPSTRSTAVGSWS